MDVRLVPLEQLEPHPGNSNVMPDELFGKLVAHLRRSERYPPVIVRFRQSGHAGPPRFQILDGHHRVKALRELGIPEARCVVWEVDDDEALLLLATLNRLQGRDDPRKRAALLARLKERLDLPSLAERLPESIDGLNGLLKLHGPPPPPRAPAPLEDMPVAVHFFLLPRQRRRLEARLRDVGGTREQALMQIVQCDVNEGEA